LSLAYPERLQEDEITIAISDEFARATVLLVLSDPQQSLACKLELEAKGYYALRTPLGREALMILQHVPVDLVIVDTVLPDMNGLELIGKIAALAPGLPIIFHAPGQDFSTDFRSWAADSVIADPGAVCHMASEVEMLLQNRKTCN
jgi:DNA-binding response OmpR family regulator